MIKKTLCFVAGKSGGHIIPCLTLAEQHCSKNPDLNILFFSANTPLDKLIVSSSNRISQHIMLSLVSANPTSFFDTFKIGWNVFYSFCISLLYLYKKSPSEIITTGGVVAIPVCIAAALLRIPITIYSLDAIPGKAIKALVPFSSKIMICFKNSHKFFPSDKCTFTSFPLRYTKENISFNQQQALLCIGLDPNKKTILILGGSQGSLFLNNCIKEWVTYCAPTTIQIIHQTGLVDSVNWKEFYKQHNIDAHIFSYHPHLASLYIAADIIICRAGAGTLFEIQFFEKQCLVIPLRATTTTHQVDNARTISQEYPALFQWIDQHDIEKNPMLLFLKINELLNTKQK